MISTKLKNILILTMLLVAAHAIEENIAGFYAKDLFIQYPSVYFNSIPQTFYWTSHIMWWLMILIGFFLILGGKWTLRILTLFGSVYFFELHHVIKGILAGQYYPGMLTGAIYPFVGFFYWKELIKNFKGGEING